MKYAINLLDIQKAYLDMTDEFKEELLHEIRSKYKTLSDFTRSLNLPIDKKSRNNDLIHFFNGHKIKVSFLFKILKPFKRLNKINTIEKNISRLGLRRGHSEIFDPKLPFNFKTEEGVRFISAILHDGGISKRIGVHYRNYNRKAVLEIAKCAMRVFGSFKATATQELTGVYFPKIIGLILIEIGFKPGEKVHTDPFIPQFILNSNNRLKGIFLRQAFDDDGSVGRRLITMSLHLDVTNKNKDTVPRLLLDNIKLIKNLGIMCHGPICTRRYVINEKGKNYDRVRWTLHITGKQNLIKFQKLVGFGLDYKKERLEREIKSYKMENPPLHNSVFYPALQMLPELEKSLGYFTISILSKRINRNYHDTKQLIWRMEKKELIKRIENVRGRYAAKFTLTDKGVSFIKGIPPT